MSISIPNTRLVIKSDDTGLWTLRDDAGTKYIETIPSLQSTGVSLTQATLANQPKLEDGVIKTIGGEPRFMIPSSGIGNIAGSGGVFVVSMRVKILSSAGVNGKFWGGRTDTASWNIYQDGNDIRPLPASTRYNMTYGDIHTVTFAGNVDTGQTKVLFDGGSIVVEEGASPASYNDPPGIFFFGEEGQTMREMHFFNVFLAEHYPSDAEMQEIHAFTQNGMPIAPRLVLTKNDAPVQGAVVKFFEMDAFSANAMDNTTVFQTVNLLPGVFQTDSNGIAQYDGAFDDTKVQGCMYVYGEYDTTWKFAVRGKLGSENINLSAPV